MGRTQNPYGPEERPNELDAYASPNAAGRAGARQGKGDRAADQLVADIAKRLRDGIDHLTGAPRQPDLATMRKALRDHQPDAALALVVADQTKVAVWEEGKAPNIAALFAAKLAAACSDERRDVRRQARESIASAGGVR